MHGRFHLGTRVGKAWKAGCERLVAHCGGQPSDVERLLIDRCVRLGLLADFAWAELMSEGLFPNGKPSPAFDAFRRASREQLDILVKLGLQRRAAPVPSLGDIWREEASGA